VAPHRQGHLGLTAGMVEVLVPPERVERWVANFTDRHGATALRVDRALHGTADDGSTFQARAPFGQAYDGPPDVAAFVAATLEPVDWGLLLVRKGGFAVARLHGRQVLESKVGQRHVQGRTKAGGQSQQRFARRRDNQARVAYEAAADHAARILAGTDQVVAGGDRAAVEAVLSDRRLDHLVVTPPWLTVPDPRRAVLDQAVLDVTSVRVEVHNT
jgi:hypothetical protein